MRLLIRDTGVPVEDILNWIAAGRTEADIIQEHPRLETADFEEIYRYGMLRLCARDLAEKMKEAHLRGNADVRSSHQR
jgi:uncharacterized protein (DUF433 family)